MLNRLLVSTCSLLLVAATSLVAEDDRVVVPFWSLAETYYRIQTCFGWSDHQVLITKHDELNTHAISIDSDVDRDSFAECFLSGTELVTRVKRRDALNADDGGPVHHRALVYLPSHDNGVTFSGTSVKIPEAIIVSDRAVTIVPSSGDYGVEDMQHVSGQVFLIQIGMATHSRIYVVDTDSGESDYLTNGSSVMIEDPDAPKFRVNGYQSYFKGGGAFWIDAVIDRSGNILDVVTSGGLCMTVEELSENSNLDLGRLPRHEVCVHR